MGGSLGACLRLLGGIYTFRPFLLEPEKGLFHKCATRTLPSEESGSWSLIFCGCHLEIPNDSIFDIVFHESSPMRKQSMLHGHGVSAYFHPASCFLPVSPWWVLSSPLPWFSAPAFLTSPPPHLPSDCCCYLPLAGA